jgi:hypothetical protein
MTTLCSDPAIRSQDAGLKTEMKANAERDPHLPQPQEIGGGPKAPPRFLWRARQGMIDPEPANGSVLKIRGLADMS